MTEMADGIRRTKGLVATLLEMIDSPKAGLDLVEAAAELVAEDARFNKWVFARKPNSSSVDLWNLAALARSQGAAALTAWHRYESATRELGDARCRELIELLRAQRDELRRTRESDVISYQDPEMPHELLDW
ncbi:hypothetical protein [Dactylosporangium sp. NPDC050588]|uniref:hypothetical protein n=1 Tax=Dactylosporangium sp. NPDC050588 TaxID=3157211 RepID=UPI0033E909B2